MKVCPICGADPIEEFTARFAIVNKCGACGHLYARDVKVDQGVAQGDASPDAMLERYRESDLRHVQIWLHDGLLSPGASLLDVGAGTGHVLRVVKRELPDVAISCVERSAKLAAFLRSEGFTVLDDIPQNSATKYDAILLIELLEHVDDPVGFLKACKSCLRPNGKIYATTPCGETRSGNRKLDTYTMREHIHFWTEKSFALCCRKAGLEFRRMTSRKVFPRKNLVEGFARSVLAKTRDAIQGRRHILGYLTIADAPSVDPSAQ